MNFTPLNDWLSTATTDSIVTERDLAHLLGKHPVSIKRAIHRGELPPPTRLFGESVWTAQAIRDHLAKRLDVARQDAERTARRISALSA